MEPSCDPILYINASQNFETFICTIINWLPKQFFTSSSLKRRIHVELNSSHFQSHGSGVIIIIYCLISINIGKIIACSELAFDTSPQDER
jgi:hypothetical protein